MALSVFVEQQLASVRAFLADPDAVLLELRAMPEQERMVTKMLVSIAEGAEGLFVGVDGLFTDPVDFCTQLEAALAEVVEQAKVAFDEDGMRLEVPLTMPAVEPYLDAAPEARLVALGEQIARELGPVFDYVAMVLRPQLPTDSSAFLACLGRLCAATESGRLKFILLGDPSKPLVQPTPVPRPRLSQLALEKDHAAVTALGAFVRSPLRRVLVYDAPARGQTWMASELGKLAAGATRVFVGTERVRFWSPVHFYGRCAEQLVLACHRIAAKSGHADRIAPFLSRIEHPRGRPDAEAYFMGLMEELADAWLPPASTLVLLLTPDLDGGDVSAGEIQAVAESITRLARAAATARVKIVVVGAGVLAACAGTRLAATRVVRVQEARMDAATIERALEVRLAAADLPLIERLRLTSAMASFSMVRGQPEQALTLGLAALELAQETNSPEEVAIAHYCLGGLLYRCAALDKAAVSYSIALDIAIERDSPILAAQSVTGVGNCYFVIGKNDEAIRAYQVAKTYYAKLGSPVGEAYALTWAAEANARMQQHGEAERLFREALSCCDRAGEVAESSRAEIQQRLALLFKKMGRAQEARSCLADAEARGATAPVAQEP